MEASSTFVAVIADTAAFDHHVCTWTWIKTGCDRRHVWGGVCGHGNTQRLSLTPDLCDPADGQLFPLTGHYQDAGVLWNELFHQR